MQESLKGISLVLLRFASSVKPASMTLQEALHLLCHLSCLDPAAPSIAVGFALQQLESAECSAAWVRVRVRVSDRGARRLKVCVACMWA